MLLVLGMGKVELRQGVPSHWTSAHNPRVPGIPGKWAMAHSQDCVASFFLEQLTTSAAERLNPSA